MKNSAWARTMLIAVVAMLVVMVSGSMNAADTINQKIEQPAKIRTAIHNQFSASSHLRSW